MCLEVGFRRWLRGVGSLLEKRAGIGSKEWQIFRMSDLNQNI